MAAYTSSQLGNANDSATWGGAGVPGIGDTATVNHYVTFTANQTIGTSPADQTTMVITIGTAGRVIVADGVTLTVKGNLYNNAGSSGNPAFGVVLGAGSKMAFDSSGATPSSTRYVFKGGYYAMIQTNGTSGSRAEFSSADGYGTLSFTTEHASYGNCITATYLDFLRVGTASVSGFGALVGPNPGNYGKTISMQNCRFISGGAIGIGSSGVGGSISLRNCAVVDMKNTSATAISFYGRAANGATLEVVDSSFEGRTNFNPPADFTVTGCYFNDSVTLNGVTALNKRFAAWSGNFTRYKTVGAAGWESPFTANYIVDDLGYSNPSLLSPGSTYGDTTITQNVIDSTGTSVAGDYLLTGSAGGYKNIITYNLFLPNASGFAGGKFTSDVYGGVAQLWQLDNNTFVVGGNLANQPETGAGVGEAGTGASNECTSFKNNLIFSKSATSGRYKMVRQQSAIQDYVSAANADYNWSWNLDAGSEGNGYHCWTSYQATAFFSTGTPDANGGSGDPQFVDWSRNIATFDTAYLGNSATAWADATAYVVGDMVSAQSTTYFGNVVINYRCITDHISASGHATNGKPGASTTTSWRTNWEIAGFYRLRENPSLIASLITWVKAGYAPRNTSLKGTGYGGADIGAVAVVTAGGGYIDLSGGNRHSISDLTTGRRGQRR